MGHADARPAGGAEPAHRVDVGPEVHAAVEDDQRPLRPQRIDGGIARRGPTRPLAQVHAVRHDPDTQGRVQPFQRLLVGGGTGGDGIRGPAGGALIGSQAPPLDQRVGGPGGGARLVGVAQVA